MTATEVYEDVMNGWDQAADTLRRKKEFVSRFYKTYRSGAISERLFLETLGIETATAAEEVAGSLRMIGKAIAENSASGNEVGAAQ